MNKLGDFQYLWTTDKDKYCLEVLNGIFYIMDENCMMLLVEDDELYSLLVEKMICNGVKIVERDNSTEKTVEISVQTAMQKYGLFKNSV